MIKYAVRSRQTDSVQFEADVDCAADAAEGTKLGLAIRWALKNGADLVGANLSGADMSRADLRDADLRDAYLSGADLRYTDLDRKNLRRARS